MAVNQESIESHLAAMFPAELPATARIGVWSLQSKLSMYAPDVDGAAKVIARMAEREDVYLGCGLAPSGLSTRVRASASQVVGVPGVWCDLDYLDDVHKKSNLPSRAAAVSFIREIADTLLEPTLTVHSGHGYQLWWLCDAWMFDSPADRTRAALCVQAWQSLIRVKAANHHWDVDATHDLARVMRIPGTVNYKLKPVDVELESVGPRWEWANVRSLLPLAWDRGADTTPAGTASAVPGRLVLDADVNPPFDKFTALLQNDRATERTWNHRRTDWLDSSQSAYDLSLANSFLSAGWADQEIVDALIANRRLFGESPKLREDYYRATLARAKAPKAIPPRPVASLSPPTTPPVVSDAGDDEPPDDDPPDVAADEPPATPNSILGQLSIEYFNGRSNNVTIESIVKYKADPPTFVMYSIKDSERVEITIGPVANLITQRQFRDKVAAVLGVLIGEVGKAQWERRAQLMLDACEERDLGDVGTATQQIAGWLDEYLDQHKPAAPALYREAMNAKRPFLYEGYLCFNLAAFAQWLTQSYGERMPRREIARYLRMASYEHYAQYMPKTTYAEASTRSVWRKKLDDGGTQDGGNAD